ncbi:TIGR04219 family outer membrane beta-barrel protein [Aliiglaciecola sp. CAU 1673]|uniref:TIGR04219 family outer membrane beta-barrel protein n=1 Tax=Aliiglaciecola sp. CAU 1673 TaxID=3032595 RepID=UPI0023DB830D|nr:TIGR04219 family outer membrane beta-barrel protein [Aliiglaciecola sp. CAU 1673]MDF2180327.1 TIGR04219 family outer membrane beta-barrel protein [Aliiglaciecola sp. CAU 1673]
MKSAHLFAISLAAASVTTAQADTLFGVYAGAQGWRMDTSGGFANTADLTNFNFDNQNQAVFYLAVEHAVPLVPNLKIRNSSMDTEGAVTLTSNFEFGSRIYSANTSVLTDATLDSTDIVLYYELFDNNLFSFDLGLNGKYLDGELLVVSSTDSSIQATEEFSGIIPMFYSRLEANLPLSGWGLMAEGSFLSIDDSKLLDYQAAITYSLLDNLALDMKFELGYRSFQLELDDVDDIYTDLDFKGPYAGLEVHF